LDPAAALRPVRRRPAGSLALQAAVLVLVAAAVGWLAHTAADNLARQGIASGFDFLHSEAGFGILQSLVDYSEQSSYGRAFLVGLLNTLLVSAIGIVLATVLGFLLGVARLSPNFLVNRLAAVYVEAVRNVPLLLQLFFWYFAVLRALPAPRQGLQWGDSVFLNIRGLYLPWPAWGGGAGWVAGAVLAALGGWIVLARLSRARRERSGRGWPAHRIGATLLVVLPAAVAWLAGADVTIDRPALAGFNVRGGIALLPEFVALVVALSLYTAAFIAEIVRAGILAVDRGQSEAGSALGLRRGQVLRLVVIPQALRVIIPPLTSQYLNLTKNSSLAAAIAYPDLVSVFAGTVLNQTGQAIEVIAITMAVYLAISLAIALGMNWYNRATALPGH